MSYLTAFIPACEGYGFNGGPEFQTRIVEMANGRERRNGNWDQPRHKYSLPFMNIDKARYAAIKNHHMACRGQLHSFLYRDPLDDEADDELFGTGDGTTTEFQLTKLSIVDGVFLQRNVTALFIPDADGDGIPADPAVTVNAAPTAVTADYERGIITFAAAPGVGTILRWSGPFAVWVRFAQDWLPFSIDSRSHGDPVHNGSVDLIELPPPEATSSGS